MMKVLKAILPAAVLLVASTANALAASSPWQELGGGKARLLASLDPATSLVSGVVEIALDPGWKTYWREPGSSGIPPQFDFSGSRHFAAGEVAFPVPEHVVLPDSEFVGYHGRVLFPFEGMAGALGPDGIIRLSLLAGVCRDICIPATAEFEIPFAALMVTDMEADTAIEQAALALPGQPRKDFSIEAATIHGSALEIRVRVPAAGDRTELFVEGPPGWNLLPAKRVGGEAPRLQFRLDLSAIPAGADPAGAKLRFTLVQDGKGIEQWLRPRH